MMRFRSNQSVQSSRPRRGVAMTCAAALGATAFAFTPGSLGAAPQPSMQERAGKTTVIRPGALAKGSTPRVLHMRKRIIHDGGRKVKVLAKPQKIELLGKSGRGYVISRINPDRLLFVRPGRKPRRLTKFSAYSGQVNATGTRVAEIRDDRGDMYWMNAVAVPSGKKLCLGCNLPEFTGLAAFPGKRMILGSGERTFWFDPKTRKRTTIAEDPAEVADPEHNRMVVWGDDGEDRFRLVAFRNPDRVLGGWSRGRPLRFSPNGNLLLTRSGFAKVQVRSTKTGRVLRTFTSRRRVAEARFETNRKILMTVTGHKVAANVRCNVAGKCVRTTRTEKWPGQLHLDWPNQDGV